MNIGMKRLTRVAGLLAGLLLVAGVAMAQRRGDVIREIHQTYPFERNGRLSLENINGDVKITGWDRAEVKLDAVISGRSQERVDEMEIDVDAYSGRLYIETRYPKRDWGGWKGSDGNVHVDYTLSVPKTAAIDEVKLVNGSIDLKGLEGPVQVSSVNGQIRADGLKSEGRLSTVNGDTDLICARIDRSAPIEVTSVNGRIKITIPSDANARISANSVHGQITSDFDIPVQKGRFVGRKLAARLGDGDGRIDLSNVNGAITIRRAADGKPQSRMESLIREEKSKGRDDDDDEDNDNDNDWDWDWDDDEDKDEDEDEDEDDGFGAWHERGKVDPRTAKQLSRMMDHVAVGMAAALNNTLKTVEIQRFHSNDRRREVNRIRIEARRSMNEARREMKKAMRELRLNLKDRQRETKRTWRDR